MDKTNMPTMRLGVAVPTYNEVANIEQLVTQIYQAVQGLVFECTVLIIDDNSPDGTGDLADQLVTKLSSESFHIEVLHRSVKEGLGRAYIAGLQELLAGNYTHILQMDADMSHDPRYIRDFIEAAKSTDLVVGSRYIPGGATPDWAPHRKLLSSLGNVYSRLMLGRAIHDYTGGYNLYSAGLLRMVQVDSITAGGYGFLIELKYRAVQCSRSCIEVPIIFHDRTQGKSKIPKNIILDNAVLVARLKIRTLRRTVFVAELS
ncbi:MAG: polyprenol monophosphomannose synthase [Candidatus Saccharimonadales bacterium]